MVGLRFELLIKTGKNLVMASYEDREAYIPYCRHDVIELCAEDGQLSESQAQQFREFCHLLAAYYHFTFHAYLERVKYNYSPFNPDVATKQRYQPSPQQLQDMESNLLQDFRYILERANYIEIPLASLKRAMTQRSLVDVKTDVDFKDFEQISCYCRGDIYKTIEEGKFFWKKNKIINLFERVALLIKFKDQRYFLEKGEKLEKLNFVPGNIYIDLYKNIPKYDLELLFPNIKISMTWKDRLLFGVPAIGAAVPVLLRAVPKITVIIGAILFFTLGTTSLLGISVSQEDVQNLMPVLAAVLSLSMILAGFAFKQYSKYKSKHIEFRKTVTDTLFFKNLANNATVFQSLIDAAEEEECKEIFLVYYHLLISEKPLTPEQLDNRIEAWMEKKFETKIDFDINGPINNLEETSGKIQKQNEEWVETSLLWKDEQGRCRILPLQDAKHLVDYIWDHIFSYSH
jgi:hypothetical protein